MRDFHIHILILTKHSKILSGKLLQPILYSKFKLRPLPNFSQTYFWQIGSVSGWRFFNDLKNKINYVRHFHYLLFLYKTFVRSRFKKNNNNISNLFSFINGAFGEISRTLWTVLQYRILAGLKKCEILWNCWIAMASCRIFPVWISKITRIGILYYINLYNAFGHLYPRPMRDSICFSKENIIE